MPLYLAFSPEEAGAMAAGTNLACLGYQLSPASPALLAPDPLPSSSSMLMLQDDVTPSYEPTEALARMIVHYARSCHTGLVCDCDRPTGPFWKTLIGHLDVACGQQQFPLWVPEAYAGAAPSACILIRSDIAGLNFSKAASYAVAAYGDRCVLELRPLSALFSLPCHTGVGQPLTPDQCRKLREQAGADFSSEELCCRYIPLEQDGTPQLVLYDTTETLQKKCEAAEAAGFRAAIGLHQELSISIPNETP